MKILIGGGGGFIGTQLCNKLLNNTDYDITVIDLLWFNNNLDSKIKVIKKDLLDVTIDELKIYDQFIFLAGLSNDPMADYNPKLNYLSNGTLPSLLAYNCKKAGIKRFIYASSCSIYGFNNNIIYENSEKLTENPYGISKYQGEIGVSNLTDDNFSTICLRLGTLSGYSPRMRFDIVLNAMYKTCITKNKITVNNPEVYRPILDIRDLCNIFLLIINSDYNINGSYNICSENVTIKELGIRVKNKMEILLNKKIDIDILNIKDNRSYYVNIDKIKKMFNYTPIYKIEDTIEYIHDNFKNKDVTKDIYNNILIFKKQFNISKKNYKIVENCRICNNKLIEVLDLGNQPLANNLIKEKEENELYPLKLMLCEKCFHSQLNSVVNSNKLFKNYLYVSGTSNTLIEYFRWFVKKCIPKYFKKKTNVLDIACNDCSLLDIFYENKWDTYGVDPAENLYNITKNKKHKVICDYWNYNVSTELKKLKNTFDIIVAQNVFAHLDDVYDFLHNCKNVMNNESLLFIQTSQRNMFYNFEFDTIYHEHMSYFSIKSMKYIIEKCGLYINNIEFVDIHGSSYLFVISLNNINNDSLNNKINQEILLNRYNMNLYELYRNECNNMKKIVYDKLNIYKKENKKIIGFGAAAKSTVFLNFCNYKLDYIVDENPLKQNLYVPGVNIIIKSLEYFKEEKENVVCVVLAWNFYEEICNKIKLNRKNNKDIIIKFY